MKKSNEQKIKAGFQRIGALLNSILNNAEVVGTTLDDETIVYTDTDSIMEGALVFKDEAMTEVVEDGEYKMANGNSFEVKDGEVVNVEPLGTNRRVARLVAKLAVKEAELAAHRAEKERFVAAAKAAKEEFEAFKAKIIKQSNYIK